MYEHYLIFQKSKEGSLIQIAGDNIFSYLKKNYARGGDMQKIKSELDKYNIKGKDDSFKNNTAKSYWDDQIGRTRIFYCTNLNRKNDFFKKHNLKRPFSDKEDLNSRANESMKHIIGFNRIRQDLKA